MGLKNERFVGFLRFLAIKCSHSTRSSGRNSIRGTLVQVSVDGQRRRGGEGEEGIVKGFIYSRFFLNHP